MTLVVTPNASGILAPSDRVVSPELVLVDPVLAVSARARLRAAVDVPVPAPAPTRRVTDPGYGRFIATATAVLDDAMDEPHTRVSRRSRSLGFVGVAALTTIVILLVDVHVEVGKTPASAEGREQSAQRREGASRETLPSPQIRTRERPPHGPQSRRFVWAPTPGAGRYHIELFRGSSRVFSANTTLPQALIPAHWKLDGRPESLVPGEYRWYVWPVLSGKRASRAIVQAKLVVPPG